MEASGIAAAQRDEVTAGGSRPVGPQGGPAAFGVLVAAWAVMCSAVVAVGWLLTNPLADSVGEVDDAVARWFADQRTPTLDAVATAAAFLGDTVAGQVGLVAIALAFSVWQRSVRPAVFVGLVEAGLLGTYLVATALVPRDRPPVEILDPGLVPDHSFPSGHVATATAIYGSIIALTWTYRAGARGWTLLLALLPPCVVLGRLYQGAHHLTDVLTSLVYAPLWVATVMLVVLWGGRSRPPVRSV